MIYLNAHYSVLFRIYGLMRSMFTFLWQLDLKAKKIYVQLYRFGINGLTWCNSGLHMVERELKNQAGQPQAGTDDLHRWFTLLRSSTLKSAVNTRDKDCHKLLERLHLLLHKVLIFFYKYFFSINTSFLYDCVTVVVKETNREQTSQTQAAYIWLKIFNRTTTCNRLST